MDEKCCHSFASAFWGGKSMIARGIFACLGVVVWTWHVRPPSLHNECKTDTGDLLAWNVSTKEFVCLQSLWKQSSFIWSLIWHALEHPSKRFENFYKQPYLTSFYTAVLWMCFVITFSLVSILPPSPKHSKLPIHWIGYDFGRYHQFIALAWNGHLKSFSLY